MEYFTATSYQNWERIGSPFDKNGKLYTKVKEKCPRCGGIGIYAIGVENGHIKPHPAYGGVCLQCGGTGTLTKEVRLYTEDEFNQMQKNAAAAKERKEAAREAKMKAEYAQKKAEWLEKNGFSSEGYTYIVTGDSYSIKDQLKKDGFKFDLVLKWHRATKDGYEDQVIEVNVNEIIEFSAWGKGYYITGAKDLIEKKLAATQPESASEWIGEVGSKLPQTKVQLIKKGGFQGQYGWSNLYNFKDTSNNIICWFTTINIDFEENDWLLLSGNVKKHDEYKGTKSTIVSRCKLLKAD